MVTGGRRIPRVQRTSDRPNTAEGRVVEIVFPKGNSAHYENITENEALLLASRLIRHLSERANLCEPDPPFDTSG